MIIIIIINIINNIIIITEPQDNNNFHWARLGLGGGGSGIKRCPRRSSQPSKETSNGWGRW